MFSNHLKIALRFTLITTVLFGVVYPLVMTGYARVADHEKADGQLIQTSNTIVGSRIIGQAFTGSTYFHSRPSAAGNGYDATSSGGSNLGLSSQKLVARIDQDTKTASDDNPGVPVPSELVEASGSGLDPDISPAAALYQIGRVARARHLSADNVRHLVLSHVEQRQLGFLGEPRVNVLTLNLALDSLATSNKGN
jgi:K+-transporting ATPase ATPase C chain